MQNENRKLNLIVLLQLPLWLIGRRLYSAVKKRIIFHYGMSIGTPE